MPCVSVLPGQPAPVCLTCHKMLSTKALGKDCTSHTTLLLKSSFPHLCPITMVNIEVQDHDLHTTAVIGNAPDSLHNYQRCHVCSYD